MGNVTKGAIALILAIAALAVATPALADTYVTEGRVAYKVYSDHAEVWDYCDSMVDIDPYCPLGNLEKKILDNNEVVVGWEYDPKYSPSTCVRPWRMIARSNTTGSYFSYSGVSGDWHAPISSYVEPTVNTGTDLVIPATVAGKPVTALHFKAFGGQYGQARDRSCTATSIDLSATHITSILAGAFSAGASKSLRSVKLPDTVTSIGETVFGRAYSQNGATVRSAVLQEINVPRSLKTVDATAFQNCSDAIQAKFSRWTTASSGSSSSSSQGASTQRRITMYRLYNPNSGEHFYTANKGERDHTIAAGWTYEGVGWTAPEWGSPVFRLYNEYAGEHHYTMSLNERTTLIACGWKDEGIGWESEGNGGKPLYRQYNPNAFANNHNYTLSKNENDTLVGIGWRAEGIAWYGMR